MLELELELGLGFLRFRFLELWVAGCCGYHPQGRNHDQEEKITTRRNVENFVQLCANACPLAMTLGTQPSRASNNPRAVEEL